MSEYRFHLQKYSYGSKISCPNCGKRRCFVRYVDEEGIIRFPDTVGKCDHENSCGYHYTPREYFHDHPQLSEALIGALVAKGVSIIGLDFAGVRRGSEHTPKDQFCADHGVFIVENLYNLRAVLDAGGRFIAHTYPMNYAEMSGLPCRVVAEV